VGAAWGVGLYTIVIYVRKKLSTVRNRLLLLVAHRKWSLIYAMNVQRNPKLLERVGIAGVAMVISSGSYE
jgi:hypothetical protein